eukprot:TRINITY_DN1175_c0_g1_i1.p1 TRINITY_DN1175_c0_g1~~TRINITY_DN1175_c0_g1_i1.p1  ORF type:complete len:367 (+),score=130.25 TRINITY_DN1175_c0_g1_i1:251-1351(+)
MGCNKSKEQNDENHDSVERYLKDESVKALTSFKVLLLGAGESGKSTVVKQLKVLHKVEMDEQEKQNYRVTIHNNTVTSMQTFVEAAEKFGYDWNTEEEKELAMQLKSVVFEENKMMSMEMAEAVSKLWKAEAIQKAYGKRAEFWNLDAANYYFENVIRFAEDDFDPTEEDCIMARVRTTGIVVTEFDEGPVHFSVVDVAGQRSERKKWIHCFDDVKCLVFVVSLAGYNQVMFEDANHNRMHEQLNLFQQIANNPVFSTTPIFLFLNKKDLFENMIQEVDLSKCFPEYSGGKDVTSALKFITNEFEKRMDDSGKKRLHVHYIAARFKKDIKYTWEDVRNVLVEENKRDVKEAERKNKKTQVSVSNKK